MNKGIAYAATAYVCWGLLPLYWKALHGIGTLEIMAHRIVWALAVALVLVAARREWRWVGEVARSPRTLAAFAASALLLSLNWFVYIWAVNQGHIVETSLGYFINPLVNVLLGVVFLRERLRAGQAAAVAVALAGVVYLTVQYGSFPAIALTLAFSFGVYGLLRKIAALGALQGFALETALLGPPALAFLAWLQWTGAGALGRVDAPTTLLLVGAGVVTAAPLLLFAAGARRIELTTLGVLQYLAPTLQFAIGVAVYGEPLTPQRLVGFALIWLALAIYTVDGMLRARRGALLRSASPASSR